MLPKQMGAAFSLFWQEADGRTKAGLTVAAVLVLISSTVAALSPVLLKSIVDLLSTADAGGEDYVAVGGLLAAYAGSQWLIKVVTELRSLVVGRTDQRVYRRLSSRLLSRVLRLPVRYCLALKAGAVSQTLANGLVGYRLVIQHLTVSVLPVLMELAMIGAVLMLLDHPAFLSIIGLSMTLYVAAFITGAIGLTKAARAVSTAQIDSGALLTESIHNFETVKYFAAEPVIDERMTTALRRTQRKWRRFFLLKAGSGLATATIFGSSLMLSVYVAARSVQAGNMTVGEFILVNSYMIQIFRPLELLGYAFRDIAQGFAFIEKMLGLVSLESEKDAACPLQLPAGTGEVVFDRVCFSYSPREPLLREVSFQLPPGKTLAIVGTSGSGKSSLIRLLVRFFEPDSGSISLDRVPVSEIRLKSLREAIAVVPQEIVLFDDTIAGNIAIGSPGSSPREIEEAARIAGIHSEIMAWPSAYETIIGERGFRLSGGERQRVAIARAVLRKPRLLVFDEATSSLDPRTQRDILARVRERLSQTSKLIIAHNLSAIVDADEILVLCNGQVIGKGNHRSLLDDSKAYRDMWDAQQRECDIKSHVFE
jgi:ATP-binding cassette subfamily B protein